MRILVRYLASEIFSVSLFVFAALATLFALFDLINEMDSLGTGNYGLPQVLLYVTLNIPGHLYELLPVAALIGSLLALSRLVANSELTIMLASGLSMQRIAQYMMLIGLGFTVMAWLLGEVVAPTTDRYAEQMKLKATHQLVAQAFKTGVWIRDKNQFINVREVTPEGGLHDINVYLFDKDSHLLSIYNAVSGRFLHDNIWQLYQINETDFNEQGVQIKHLAQTEWRSVLTPAIMNVLLLAPEQMSAQDLFAYVGHLRANHQPSQRYQIALWSKLIYPLAAPIMLLLAVPFAWHRPRAGAVGARVLMGIMVGLGFHMINRLFAYIGLLNGWPPLISVITPSVAFLLLGWVMLRRIDV